MHITNYPSITQFQQHVELKDYRKPTTKEYVRYVRKLAEHFQCDPATLTENQIRQYFLFLRQHTHYTQSPMMRPTLNCLKNAHLRVLPFAERQG
jgi:hypothetical protein